MGTLNTRISIRSSNTFRNTVTFRHDRAYAVETRVDQGTRNITENTSISSVAASHFHGKNVNWPWQMVEGEST